MGQNIYMQVLPVGHVQHATVSTTLAVRKWLDEVDEHDGRLSTAPYTYGKLCGKSRPRRRWARYRH